MKKLIYHTKLLLLGKAFCIIASSVAAQNFIEMHNNLPQLPYSQIQFIDYDCDDDLDIYVWGLYDPNKSKGRSSVVYRNNGSEQFDSVLVETDIYFGSTLSSVTISDINCDNIPEMVSIGGEDWNIHFNQYELGTFKRLKFGDENIISRSYYGFWFADYDNDGFEELLSEMQIYDPYKQTYILDEFDSQQDGLSCWIDINNDGKIDVLRSRIAVTENTSSLYINTGGTFEEKKFDYNKRVWSIALGDYNNDGYEDILITSHPSASTRSLDLYKNDGNGGFIHVQEFESAVRSKFIDVDNDGDLDIAIVGHYDVWDVKYLQFYINNGDGTFSVSDIKSIETDWSGDIEIADYDKDGDLDILLTTTYGIKTSFPKLLKNSLVEDGDAKPNAQPSVPVNLNSTVDFNRVKLSWDKSTDEETPEASIAYNVYIRKEDGSFITSPLANVSNGFQRSARSANAGYKTYYDINCLADGVYYWSVQALDNSNLGSSFATEKRFEISGTQPEVPTELIATTISDTQIELKWQDNSAIEDGFIIEQFYQSGRYADTPGFYECQRVEADEQSCIIENLHAETEYVFRIKAFNCSANSFDSNTDTVTTYPIPFTKEVLLDKSYGREAEWGDFDSDGDLDLLIFYNKEDAYGKQSVGIMENINGRFEDLINVFPEVEYFGGSRNGSLNWVDFNSDGLLDVCLIHGESFSAEMSLFKNNGDKTFTKVVDAYELPITPGSCGPAFADYDNDGDLDMLLMGRNNDTYNYSINIFENESFGRFVKTDTAYVDVYIKSRNPWCDFNNDGLIDILANERYEDNQYCISILKNNGDKTFSKLSLTHLPGLNSDVLNQAGDMCWGDYNNDGYTDILLSGAHTGSNGSGITRVYKNNGDETFTDSGIDYIYGMAHDVSIEWGDYNNDGVLDILQTGDGWINGVRGQTRIFYNIDGVLEKTDREFFLGVHQQGMSSAADYDNDGDLDILNLGEINYTHHQVALFNNFQPFKNTKPSVPSNLRHKIEDYELILEWDVANDNETPSEGLSYNVYLKNDTGYVISPHALSDGKRTIVSMGNASQNNFMRIKLLEKGEYTWSVQSIDHCFEGSEFADELVFNTHVGIDDEVQLTSRYKLYPNPCDNQLNIANDDSNNSLCDVIVTDISGTQVKKVVNVNLPHNIDLSSLKSGIYFVSINQLNSTSVHKVIKK